MAQNNNQQHENVNKYRYHCMWNSWDKKMSFDGVKKIMKEQIWK